MEVIEFEISNNTNKEKYAFDIKYIDEVFRYKKSNASSNLRPMSRTI